MRGRWICRFCLGGNRGLLLGWSGRLGGLILGVRGCGLGLLLCGCGRGALLGLGGLCGLLRLGGGFAFWVSFCFGSVLWYERFAGLSVIGGGVGDGCVVEELDRTGGLVGVNCGWEFNSL